MKVGMAGCMDVAILEERVLTQLRNEGVELCRATFLFLLQEDIPPPPSIGSMRKELPLPGIQA